MELKKEKKIDTDMEKYWKDNKISSKEFEQEFYCNPCIYTPAEQVFKTIKETQIPLTIAELSNILRKNHWWISEAIKYLLRNEYIEEACPNIRSGLYKIRENKTEQKITAL